MILDRRAALTGVLALFGTSVFAPLARAAQMTAAQLIPDGPPSVAVFSPAQRALMTALSERVIPTTDTPGAIAAGVPAFIEKLLADWAMPDDRVPILAGLDAIEARSMRDHDLSAVRATPAQQDALLTLAMNGDLPGADKFFVLFRQLVITGYYTSEIGMTKEREYLPVPGEYNGEFLYSNINKVYSA